MSTVRWQRVGTGTYSTFGVQVGATYTVYGVGIFDGMVFYLVNPGEDGSEPLYIPAECFLQPSGPLPPLMGVEIASRGDRYGTKSVFVSGRWMIGVDDYYGRLVEGDPELSKLWVEFRTFADFQEGSTAAESHN